MSATAHHVTEDAVHHTRTYAEVNDGLFVTVVDSCEFSLLGLLLDHLYLVDDLGRDILCRKLRVIEEECLAIDGDLLDSLTVSLDGTVCIHLYTREFLKKLLEHVVIGSLE